MNTHNSESHLTRLALGFCLAGLALQPVYGSGTVLRPGFPSEFIPTAISADGAAVAGFLPPYQGQWYSMPPVGQLWRTDGGFSQIGHYGFQPWRRAISDDGNVVAGKAIGFRADPHTGACSWNVSEGMGIYMPNSWDYGRGLALTPDGSKMVWADNDADFGLFISDGATHEKISTDTPYCAAVSSDGATVAYYSLESDRFRRWTMAGGVVTLASLPGMHGGEDVALSADGMRVYGVATTADAVLLVLWDCSGIGAGGAGGGGMGMAVPVQICSVPRDENGYPNVTIAGVSADERTIAFSVDSRSYIWNAQGGLQDFETFLSSRDIEFGPHAGITVLCMNKDASIFAGVSGSYWYLDLNNAPSFCPADLNFDRLVDDADFEPFAVAYDLIDCANPDMAPACPGDLNRDGVVDDADFVLFAAAYGALLCG